MEVDLNLILHFEILSASSIATENSEFLYLSISRLQMLEAPRPVFIFLLFIIIRVENPHRFVALGVALILIGSMLSLEAEIKFSYKGFLLQFPRDIFDCS